MGSQWRVVFGVEHSGVIKGTLRVDMSSSMVGLMTSTRGCAPWNTFEVPS